MSDHPSTPGQPQDGTSPRTGRKRRPRQRFVPDTSVPSPCLAVCMIEKSSRLCQGCKRSMDEIRDWMILSADEKRAILADLPNR